jgi:hypothetical protein
MSRSTPAVVTVAITAVLLGLLEPALAVSDAERFLFILLLLVFFRFPVLFASLLDRRRAESA